MIVLDRLSKAYGEIQALDQVSLELKAGELCGLLGRNGAGKSTLFKILVGLVPPDSGTLRVEGQVVPFGDITFKRRIGYVPENDLLDDYLTVGEFLEFVGAIREIPAGERAEGISRWLDFFGLADRRKALLIECSQGMRRKVSLSAAFLARPQLLLLDEAMNGLDPESRARLKGELKRFCAAGGTVLFSSHALETVEAICDRVAILATGVLKRELRSEEWGGEPGGLERIFLEVSR